jgi:hypothetical protein
MYRILTRDANCRPKVEDYDLRYFLGKEPNLVVPGPRPINNLVRNFTIEYIRKKEISSPIFFNNQAAIRTSIRAQKKNKSVRGFLVEQLILETIMHKGLNVSLYI